MKKKIKVQNKVYGKQPSALKIDWMEKYDFMFIKYFWWSTQETGNGGFLWEEELNSWVFQLSISA